MAEWKDPPGRLERRWSCKARRMHKLVIKGYYRALQHRYTLDLMCRRCSQRRRASLRPIPHPPPSPEKRKRKYLRVLFGSIGFPACGTRFLLKAPPTSRKIRFAHRFIPSGIEYNDIGSIFNVQADASPNNGTRFIHPIIVSDCFLRITFQFATKELYLR